MIENVLKFGEENFEKIKEKMLQFFVSKIGVENQNTFEDFFTEEFLEKRIGLISNGISDHFSLMDFRNIDENISLGDRFQNFCQANKFSSPSVENFKFFLIGADKFQFFESLFGTKKKLIFNFFLFFLFFF